MAATESTVREHPIAGCSGELADMGLEWTFCPFCGGRLPVVTNTVTIAGTPVGERERTIEECAKVAQWAAIRTAEPRSKERIEERYLTRISIAQAIRDLSAAVEPAEPSRAWMESRGRCPDCGNPRPAANECPTCDSVEPGEREERVLTIIRRVRREYWGENAVRSDDVAIAREIAAALLERPAAAPAVRALAHDPDEAEWLALTSCILRNWSDETITRLRDFLDNRSAPAASREPGARGARRGHPIRYDEAAEVWRYVDTGEPVPENPDRDCANCGLPADSNDPDPCLGRLPGVMNACCGHGDSEDAYVQFENGVTIRGFGTIEAPAASPQT